MPKKKKAVKIIKKKKVAKKEVVVNEPNAVVKTSILSESGKKVISKGIYEA